MIHPRKEAARRSFYPFTCTVKEVGGDALSNDEASAVYSDVPGLANLRCAYSSAAGGEPEDYEIESPAADRILLMGYFPQIKPGMRLVLDLRGEARWFSVSDALPAAHATQTLLLVSPQG